LPEIHWSKAIRLKRQCRPTFCAGILPSCASLYKEDIGIFRYDAVSSIVKISDVVFIEKPLRHYSLLEVIGNYYMKLYLCQNKIILAYLHHNRTMLKRSIGAQPVNTNALKQGFYSQKF